MLKKKKHTSLTYVAKTNLKCEPHNYFAFVLNIIAILINLIMLIIDISY